MDLLESAAVRFVCDYINKIRGKQKVTEEAKCNTFEKFDIVQKITNRNL